MISASLVKELREKSGAGMLDCKSALENNNGDIEASLDWLREKGFAQATKKASRIAAEGLTKIFVDGNKAIVIEVNSETDFVSKNEEFIELINTIGNEVIKSDALTVEEVLNLPYEGKTINDLMVAKISKIGEKLSLRRLSVLNKTESQNFGEYSHNGGKISVITVVEGGNTDIAKDVAMQAAAMKPQYLKVEDIPSDVVDHERSVLKEQSMNEGKTEEIAAKMVEGRIKKYYKDVVLLHQDFIKDSDLTIEVYLKSNNAELVEMIRYEVGEGMEKRSDNFAEEVMTQIKGE